MRGDDDADAAVHAAKLFDSGHVFDIAQTCSAEFFGEDDSHEPEFAHLADDVARELASFIALLPSGKNLLCRECADCIPQCSLLFCQAELHSAPSINKTNASIRLPNTHAIVQPCRAGL